MNDFDDVIFARFVRRFAQIEHVVPGPPARTFPPMTHRRAGAAALKRTAILIGAVLLLGAGLVFAAVGLQPSPTPTPVPTQTPSPRVTIPPDSAAPDVVLGAYLSALQARDCDTAEEFVSSVVYRWRNDALCGGWTYITGFRITGVPEQLFAPNRIRQPTVVAITGGGAWPAAEIHVAFELQQLASGAWRIVQAYPGSPLPPNTFPVPPTPRPT